ncbi:hypothetical protein AVEN_116434-1 [Araneus ventricosus]|uniref:Uncharacterized protein n=1 Tax=Araneus ventricosus TaxID=182803 RepID=A0A4Y2KIK2_ARAVE|nr:hypothetical protein AVEN_116434-1 [Araneus ventricosus]
MHSTTTIRGHTDLRSLGKNYQGSKNLSTLDTKYKKELRGKLADHFSTSPNLSRHLSERRTNLFSPAWQKSRPVPLSQFSATVFTSLSEDNLAPDECSFNFGTSGSVLP